MFLMKKKPILLLLPLLLLTGCASNKLTKSMWYNATMVNNDGTWGAVVTSMWFERDSVYAFNGVSVDNNVVIEPYLYAIGKYSCKKTGKNIYHVQIDGKTNIGESYRYNGQLNRKDRVMHLSVPDQRTNESYFYEPKVKLQIPKKK